MILMETSVAVNRNEEIRDDIIQYLYAIHKNARGVKSISINISGLKKVMKQKDYSQQEVVSNVDYLVQTKWVTEVKDSYTFNSGKRVITNVKITYKISDLGIDYIEGTSKFQKPRKVPAINVNTINGVTVLGDGNYVYDQYGALYNKLHMLSEEILNSNGLSEQEKLHTLAEIETIQKQLAKPEPDKSTVRGAWERINAVAERVGTFLALQPIAELIRSLF